MHPCLRGFILGFPVVSEAGKYIYSLALRSPVSSAKADVTASFVPGEHV